MVLAGEVSPSFPPDNLTPASGKNGNGYQPKAGRPLAYPLEMMDTGAGTVSFWVRLDGASTAAQGLPLLSSGSPPNTWFYLFLDKGRLGVLFQKGVKPFTGLGEFYLNNSVDVADWAAGSWHHVAFSWVAAGPGESVFSLTLDGKVREEKSNVSLAGGSPLESVTVGANSARRDSVATSVTLDELKIWNLPLRASQVQEVKEGKDPEAGSLVLSVDFERGLAGTSSASLSPDLSRPETLAARFKQ